MTLRRVWRHVMTGADKVLVVVLLLLSMFSYVIIRSVFPYSPERTAIVQVRGQEVIRLSLSPGVGKRKVPIDIKGGEAWLEIAEGRIRMLPMDDDLCPKHICSRTGWIGKPWQMIVCMPNKVVVRIVGEKKSGDIDLITR